MLDFSTAVLFFSASLLLALAPGPDNLFVLAQAALRGPLVGLVVTLGLCTGLMIHTSAVVLGLAAVFATSTLAFSLLKGIGAVYLLYLAWGAFRAGALSTEPPICPAVPLFRFYLRGIVMNVTNPKVSIFFLAFLPQFTRPEQGSPALQLVLLGGVFIAAALLVFGSISLLAGRLGPRLARSPVAQRLLNRAAGTLFAALALRLALSSR